MSKIKLFFAAALKITVAIVLAIIVLSLFGWGIYSFTQHRENVNNAPLEKPRTWALISIPSLDNSSFKLSTMWREGQLSYQFEMTGFPKSLETSIQHGNPSFTLSFLDKNGFKLYDHKIIGSDIIRIVDDKGKYAGISSKGYMYLNADTYRKAQTWEITWAF